MISFVNGGAWTSTGATQATPLSVTVNGTINFGDLIIIIAMAAATTLTISDAGSHAWTLDTSIAYGTNGNVYLWHTTANGSYPSGVSVTITPGANSAMRLHTVAYRGNAGTQPDGVATATNSGSATSAGAVTPSQPGVVVAAVASTTSFGTPNVSAGGFTKRTAYGTAIPKTSVADLFTTAGGAYNCVWTNLGTTRSFVQCAYRFRPLMPPPGVLEGE